jgi:hypothetical protein
VYVKSIFPVPQNPAPPVISGSVVVGQSLGCSAGKLDEQPDQLRLPVEPRRRRHRWRHLAELHGGRCRRGTPAQLHGDRSSNAGAGSSATSAPVTPTAGTGNDKVNSRDKRRETVRCGKGKRDRVTADRSDRLIGCDRRARLALHSKGFAPAESSCRIAWASVSRRRCPALRVSEASAERQRLVIRFTRGISPLRCAARVRLRRLVGLAAEAARVVGSRLVGDGAVP